MDANLTPFGLAGMNFNSGDYPSLMIRTQAAPKQASIETRVGAT
jgi:hypothetical protein